MKIDQKQEPGYECVTVCDIGFIDPYAMEGLVVLQSDDGREFCMSAFSGEVARHIAGFLNGESDSTPTVYKMIEEICEHNEMYLVKVKIYESAHVFRANLYFAGKNELVMRNYRASDALALAAYYNIPILIRDGLLARRRRV